jgi:hypothetical protein
MKTIPFVSEPTDLIPGLSQEAVSPRDWCYTPDWIVTHLSLDTGRGGYAVTGWHLDNGQSFFWLLDARRPLSWRYDLTNATYAIGRHQAR